MRLPLVYLLLAIGLFLPSVVYSADDADNEFAEFEQFDEEDDSFVDVNAKDTAGPGDDDFDSVRNTGGADQGYQDDGIVEDEQDDEFDPFQDEEEFEGFHGDEDLPATPSPKQPAGAAAAPEPKLTMAKVPLHFRTHWDSYYMEMIVLAGIFAYFANYLMGKGKNSKIVNDWLNVHRGILEDNFVLVGDDGKMDLSVDNGGEISFMRESDSQFALWCSGRTCCEGMLVELKLIKRQDLISILAGFMKPASDQMLLKVELSKDIFDTFVFAVAVKKTATKLFKEQSDLSKYCTLVGKSDEKYKVPSGFTVLSEIPEASTAVLDSRLLAALHKYAPLIEYIHISDQYSGPVPPAEDQTAVKEPPEVKRMLMAAFNLPTAKNKSRYFSSEEEYQNSSKALLTLVFYVMERLKNYRMSREGKSKADKNRQRVRDQYQKSTNAARKEEAAARGEAKRKAEKEKILAEEDPDKQRRMEAKELKREAKKKQPRMKKLSIKAM